MLIGQMMNTSSWSMLSDVIMCLSILERVQRWQDTWNFYRPSFGIALNRKTSWEKLISSHTMIQEHVLLYPVVLMEDVFQMRGPPGLLLQEQRGGTCRIDTKTLK